MKKLLIATTMATVLCGCQSTALQSTQIKDEAAKQAAVTNITQEQAIADARDSVKKAYSDKLDYYTPLHLSDAQDKLTSIEKLQKEKEENKVAIMTEAFTVKKLISEAYTVKETILSTLSPAFEHKAVLEKLGANKEFPNDFEDINDDLADLFELIEKNQVEKARKEQVDLLADMAELEVNTLLKLYIAPAEFILEKAEDEDADQYAEKTFEKAEDTIERSEDFIKHNYQRREEVKAAGEEAVLAAKQALNTGALSKKLFQLDEENAELEALEMESLLDDIAKALGATETDGLSIKEKAAKLSDMIHDQTVLLKRNNITQN